MGETASDAERARAAAVALLARRDIASGELLVKLKRKGFSADAARSAIDALQAERLLNDERYAENYVRYHAGRGHGPVRIARELGGFGVAAAVIEGALAVGPDWRRLAREVRTRKFGDELPGSLAEKARQGRFLQYRGFSADHIRLALGADYDLD
ncbi:MAG: regulatory protein RecX [Sinobacteraceae bacterium]|nr:regulatory protein RecX [Nevskiaceae bacterium]